MATLDVSPPDRHSVSRGNGKQSAWSEGYISMEASGCHPLASICMGGWGMATLAVGKVPESQWQQHPVRPVGPRLLRITVYGYKRSR